MPELDGLALARALEGDAMTAAIPVVLLTARATAEDQVAGLATGADAYVVKPFEPGVLEAHVAGLLAQRRRLREHFRRSTPVIMNLSDMDDADAKRLVDFAAGLTFGLHGRIERVTAKVFLLSPNNVTVTASDKAKIENGFFNQS